jgi:hypothetical protein
MDLNQVSVEARELPHLYLCTDQETADNENEMCGDAIMIEE